MKLKPTQSYENKSTNKRSECKSTITMREKRRKNNQITQSGRSRDAVIKKKLWEKREKKSWQTKTPRRRKKTRIEKKAKHNKQLMTKIRKQKIRFGLNRDAVKKSNKKMKRKKK